MLKNKLVAAWTGGANAAYTGCHRALALRPEKERSAFSFQPSAKDNQFSVFNTCKDTPPGGGASIIFAIVCRVGHRFFSGRKTQKPVSLPIKVAGIFNGRSSPTSNVDEDDGAGSAIYRDFHRILRLCYNPIVLSN